MELPLTRFLPKGSSENGVSARKKEECSRPIPFNAAGDTILGSAFLQSDTFVVKGRCQTSNGHFLEAD